MDRMQLEPSAADLLNGIVYRLEHEAIHLRGGVVSWKAPFDAVDSDCRNTPRFLGPHLYDGTTGVALFLAAHYKITGSEISYKLCLACLKPLECKLLAISEVATRTPRGSLPIGGYVGLGSFIYGFVKCAQWIGAGELLRAARAAAALITPDLIQKDRYLDVISGCSGAALALLTLYEEPSLPLVERERALELAVLCGERLLLSRSSTDTTAARGWPGFDRPAIGGFAHGAAGICYSLVRLYFKTGNAAFRDAAVEGVEFERALYMPEVKGWLDPRFGKPLDQVAWCNGAAGIALSRSVMSVGIDPIYTDDVNVAVSITLTALNAERDHLCCGNSGLAEVLRVISVSLKRPELMTEARKILTYCITRAAQEGGLRFPDCPPGPGQHSDPSLLLGASGFGYTLLRFTGNAGLPCLLLLE